MGEGWSQKSRGPVSLAELTLWEVWVGEKGGAPEGNVVGLHIDLRIPRALHRQAGMMAEKAWRM